MIYVIADIHGEKEKYFAMLEKLKLSKKDDSVFVLGDVIDIGNDGIEILQDMMYNPMIYPILGDHEYMAKKLLPLITEAKTLDEAKEILDGEEAELFGKWLLMDSEKTITDFLALDDEGKESIIDFLSEFQPYEELEVGGKTFFLTHAGIDGFDENKAIDDYDEEAFVFAKTDYTKPLFTDKYLVTGHMPTLAISRDCSGKVYVKNKHLAIDCGAAYGMKLAAVCLDALKVYYV